MVIVSRTFGDSLWLNQDVQHDFSLRKDLSIQKALFIVKIKWDDVCESAL